MKTKSKLSDQEQIFKDYETKADKIIRKMFSVLIQAHEKVDKQDSRKTLEKFKTNIL